MPFSDFRRAVADIATQNFQAVRGAVVEEWDFIPDGAIVLPCDDDDWFAPNAAEVISTTMGPAVGCMIWRQSVLEVPINLRHACEKKLRFLIPWLRPRWLCATNNYAIRKSQSNRAAMLSHLRASRMFQEHKSVHILESLSLQNRHLGSSTSLVARAGSYLAEVDGKLQVQNVSVPENLQSMPKGVSRRLLSRLERYQKLYASYRPERADLAWAAPYVHEMQNLTMSLKRK